jgi:endonuclease-8
VPEGPEIRLAADRLSNAIAGKTATEVWFAFDRLKPWARKLRGRQVRSVEARGKALLVRFAGGLNLYSHNQLYGRWYVTRNGDRPRTRRQLRVALHTRERSALLYSASEIEVLRDGDLVAHPYLSRLGVDLLEKTLRPAALEALLEDARFARRHLGGLLLDQGFLCGVGNYLRSEILFVAGLDPARRPSELSEQERTAFARSALRIGRRAYRQRGVTNDPAIVRKMRARKLPRSRYRHFVFDRDGEPCHRCGTSVRKSQVAGRRLFSCPRCQC